MEQQATLNFTQKDLIQFKNLLVMLKRAKFDDIEGQEVLGFAQAYGWLGKLVLEVDNALKPMSQIAKKVESPIKKAKKGKK